MPISTEDWEEGSDVDTLPQMIILFLSENADQAYTLSEVAEGIRDMDFSKVQMGEWGDRNDIADMLITLDHVGDVDTRLVNDEVYFKKS